MGLKWRLKVTGVSSWQRGNRERKLWQNSLSRTTQLVKKWTLDKILPYALILLSNTCSAYGTSRDTNAMDWRLAKWAKLMLLLRKSPTHGTRSNSIFLIDPENNNCSHKLNGHYTLSPKNLKCLRAIPPQQELVGFLTTKDLLYFFAPLTFVSKNDRKLIEAISKYCCEYFFPSGWGNESCNLIDN